jgi:hypothetical protein
MLVPDVFLRIRVTSGTVRLGNPMWTPMMTGGAMGDHYHNEASGNARFGFQIGRVDGDVSLGDMPVASKDSGTEMLEALLRIRTLLEAAAAHGDLDSDLVPVARASLDAADRAAAEAEPDRGRLLRALGALRETVQGVAGISSAVTSIISSVGSGQ